MLALTRKAKEQVVIGENIVVTVVSIEPGRVKLAFDAPKDVPIYRQELLPMRQPERTKADVMVARSTSVGCCSRHADNQACDCMEAAK